MKNKLINECQFCKSRFCYHRLVRTEPPLYDEVYCDKHIDEGEAEADRVLGTRNGTLKSYMRTHISGTGIQRRGIAL